MTAPLRNVGVGEAGAAWHAALREAGGMQPLAPETIELALAVGRMTAGPVVARSSSPPFDAAAMDGIAVAAIATRDAPVTLATDAFRPIDTGGVLPVGTNAVVKHEDISFADGATVEREVVPYANVRQVGEDVAVGDLLLRPSHDLRPVDLAVAASAGEATISVRRRPVVTILPSGDELVPLGFELGPGEIFETNSLMLGAMVEQAGGVARKAPIVPDDPNLLAEALGEAAARADLVLLLSGSAKGTADHTVAVIERLGKVVVQGVAVRPGHPVILGVVGTTPVIGVPGYPVSAALAFELFAAPLLATLGGWHPTDRPRVRATARAEILSTPRSDEWVRVRIGRIAGGLVVLPLRRGAGVLTSLSRADGLVCVPSGSSSVAEGDEVEVDLLRPLDAIEAALLVTGSTDPLLDHLIARLRVDSTQTRSGELCADPDGSGNGAASLVSGRCHLALVVSEDVPAGALVLGAWERRLGLLVASGNPLAINDVEALRRPEVRFANRQRGSSTRNLLDALLAERSIDSAAVTGYSREARSHAAAAAAVATGAADCALGVSSAGNGQHLEFVPLATQTLALVAASDLENDNRVVGLRALLGSSEFHDEIEALGHQTLPS
jgi:putative molybdopterin biosynthesis protein